MNNLTTISIHQSMKYRLDEQKRTGNYKRSYENIIEDLLRIQEEYINLREKLIMDVDNEK